ncbi:MAG: hypothetical protein OXI56_05580 [bacterium]|nr:hypothetical protein [bacterium]MDE0601248.1 hypothetical protein [bacterium]
MDAETGTRQQLVRKPSSRIQGFAWSPDSSQIAYGTGHIFVIDLDSGTQQQLTQDKNNIEPTWSPDGARIAFTSDLAIHVMDLGGQNKRQLSPSISYGPVWSPDGARIAYLSRSATENESSEVFVVGLDGANPQRLTYNDTHENSIRWSPDGNRILFVSRRDGDAELFTMDADGSNVQQLTHNDYGDYDPAWCPAGG